VIGRVRAAWSDSLVRNSLLLMLGTVLTAGLGFGFWTLAARAYPAEQVGAAAAAVAAATAISLLVHLGPAAALIERLPRHQGTEAWGRRVWTVTIGTSVLSALLAAAVVAVAGDSPALGGAAGSGVDAVLVVLGCAAWSGSNVLFYAFVAARRSDRTALLQAVVSVLKLVLLMLFWAGVGGALLGGAGGGQRALLAAWSLSAVVGTAVGLAREFRRAGLPLGPPRLVLPGRGAWRSVVGHHLTSVGAVLTPYLLPPLVAVLVSATDNAYFYLTWMLGSLFFMVSPSVAASLFAEGVHAPAEIGAAVRRTARLIALLLVGPVLVALAGGRLVLGVFGADYARNGYLLLVLLVVSTVPDAVTNIAVGLFRATGRLGRSTVLNTGMAAVTLVGSALLTPVLGIDGVGVAWLLAQTAGALWVLPALLAVLRAGSPAPAEPTPAGTTPAETVTR
jgi:O-antigen/teichoic acid export membrane protein